jgi:uncharacterized membrane protein YraQ (UPF0718 family)
MAATNRANISILDYYKKRGSTSINVAAVTAANFTAQATALGAFVAAVTAVQIGTVVESFVDAMLTTHTPTPPTNQAASRATKWLVRAVDQINGRAVTFSIPAADQTLLAGNSPFLNLATTPGSTLKTDTEAYVFSVDGNAITVISVEYVPRSN